MRDELDAEVQRLLESQTQEEVVAAVLVGAGALAHADGARVAELTVDGGVRYRVVGLRGSGVDIAARMVVDPLGHPLIRHYLTTRTTELVSVDDILPGRRWIEHPLYREVYRPEGLRSQISGELVHSNGAVTTLSLARGGSDFDTRERESLARYRRILRTVWLRVRQWEQTNAVLTALDHVAEDDGALVMVLPAHGGEVLYSTRSFAAALEARPLLTDELQDLIRGSPLHRAPIPLDADHTIDVSWASDGDLIVVRGIRRDRLGLSTREIQALQALSSGMTARAAASELGVATSTLNKHLEHAYAKLGAHDRVSAVTIAREHGVIR